MQGAEVYSNNSKADVVCLDVRRRGGSCGMRGPFIGIIKSKSIGFVLALPCLLSSGYILYLYMRE